MFLLSDLFRDYLIVFLEASFIGLGVLFVYVLIRHAVAEGDFGRVRELSDHPFRFAGVVVRGDQRGRELGYPTANVPVSG